MPGQPTIEDVQAAAALLEGVVVTTPVQESRWLSKKVGGRVICKCENLQRTGSFKIRGAYTRISRLDPDIRARGVVAASAGNHAQGVALAARLLGVASTVFTPEGASLPKLAATRAYGADVREGGDTLADALAAAEEFAVSTGAELIHPYDHADVVSGQGTVGLELLAQVPQARTVVVPTGGGGLIAGIALAVKAQAPDVRVIGVQATGAAAYPQALRAGRPVRLKAMATMADGIAVPLPGEVPFGLVRDLVDDVVTVSEDSLAKALLLMLERGKLVVEPAGVAGVAAVMDAPDLFEPPVVVVLSGGNADPVLLQRVLLQGMAAAGRFLTLRVPIPDSPGALAHLLEVIGHAGGNVSEVSHMRAEPSLAVNEVEVAVTVETRGQAHSDLLLEHLIRSGYTVRHN